MLISCVTAAWRVEGLKRVVESIDNQLFQNWQHIIINDNSPDVRKYLEEQNYFIDNPKRHVIDMRVRTHWYGCYARNIGIQIAFTYLRNREREKGNEWISINDDDNYFDKYFLMNFESGLIVNPNAVLIGQDMVRVGVKTGNRTAIPCAINSDSCDLGNFLYKKELFDKYGYFRARDEKKIKFDYELIKKIVDGEGMEKVELIHTDKPSFYYYNKKY